MTWSALPTQLCAELLPLQLEVGDVWDVHMPYSDDPNTRKHRPCVVLSWSEQGPTEDSTIIVVPITSFGGGSSARNGDVLVLDQELAGLNRQSWVRARRLFGADTAAFDSTRRRRRGTLDTLTLDAVMLEVEKVLTPPNYG